MLGELLYRRKKVLVAALMGLVLLTLLAVLPGNPAGPYDARTNQRVEGFRLEFPTAGAIIEPFAAPSHVLSGALDYRVAILSALVWAFFLGGLCCTEWKSRPWRWRESWRPVLKAVAAGVASAVIFAAYALFCLLVRMPGWSLVSETGDFIIADLQSHTFGSHDGIVSASENLALHRARGCDVVAVTEHNDTQGSAAAEELSRRDASLPAVIPGVELRERGIAYLLGLNVYVRREDVKDLDLRDPAKFAAYVHGYPSGKDEHGGAVLALSWRLTGNDVYRLTAAGVDGFEIANFGHPIVQDGARQAMLNLHREQGIALVSSSDWHGWGGAWRTWTAVKAPGKRQLERSERARAVLAALRGRDTQDIIPLVAGRFGVPTMLHSVLAPFTEAVRYARELSAVRVTFWWLWVALLFGATALMDRAQFRARWVLLASLLLVVGTGLTLSGAGLIRSWISGEASYPFPARIGAWALALGICGLLASTLILLKEYRVHVRARGD